MYSGRSSRPTSILVYAVLILLSIWAVFPFYWVIVTSFKHPKDTLGTKLIPFVDYQPTLENWKQEIGRRWPELSKGLKNSLSIAVTTSLLTLFLGSMAGFSLARYRFRRWSNKNILIFFLSQRMLPPVVLVIPFLLMFKAARLVDSQLALILVNTTINLPFVVLIMRDIFREIPPELDEAARVEGCSSFAIFYKVALPLAGSGLVAAGILVFAFTWNEYLFALSLAYQRAVTIPLQIAGTGNVQGVQFWITSVRGLVAVLPPVVLALSVQRFIVRGLTFGALKG
ncbi:MAG: carbohydrate ABC transporter permease [Deltaproteobacteria bacterium]|nr:carbohydrate ABC transporter permease [Deltaproteobacteria bacterium]MBW2122338.1 carbohydrate ABC transporter permease [Deltaproteobacteria bacterium]